ncbi:hypothetical protein ACFE04_003471 [Oxalis oulophora]
MVYGKTANEMRGAKDGNIELFPADLELIEGRSFLFKVHVKPSTKVEGETVFHVIKLTEDKDRISKFGGQTNNHLHSDALISVEDETPHSKAEQVLVMVMVTWTLLRQPRYPESP